MSDERPVLLGFRDATEHPGHKRIQLFAGRNEGARGNSGTLVFRDDEWPAVRAALMRGGFEEMPSIARIAGHERVGDALPWDQTRGAS